jgi:hypothetical protein
MLEICRRLKFVGCLRWYVQGLEKYQAEWYFQHVKYYSDSYNVLNCVIEIFSPRYTRAAISFLGGQFRLTWLYLSCQYQKNFFTIESDN